MQVQEVQRMRNLISALNQKIRYKQESQFLNKEVTRKDAQFKELLTSL